MGEATPSIPDPTICTCGDPRDDGRDHRRCYLIDAIEYDRDFGGPPDDRWEP